MSKGKEERKGEEKIACLTTLAGILYIMSYRERILCFFFKKNLLFILPTSLINHLHLTHPST